MVLLYESVVRKETKTYVVVLSQRSYQKSLDKKLTNSGGFPHPALAQEDKEEVGRVGEP